MSANINYLAVVVAAVVAMVIGGVWHSPLMFAKQWQGAAGVSEETKQRMMAKGMTKAYILQFIGALVMSFVLAHSLVFASAYLNISGISAGLQAGIWNWLGFIATVTLGAILWEGKPWKLWFIINGYQIINLCAMGVILSLWR